MDYVVEVRVSLKEGVLDAEGETVAKSLGLLGFDVKKVEAVKAYKVTVAAKTKDEAKKTVTEACERLLANPVIQDYEVRVP